MSATTRTYGGRYEITGSIASGGMAEVFSARDNMLDRQVAVKILHQQFAKDRSFIERFRREAKAAASLNDPKVVSIYDWGSDEGTYYIVMEYVEGKTLRDIISNEGPLTAERAVEIAADVCGALHLAHEKGLVHRDVKPANIAITKNGQTKVMDFGIARAADDAGDAMTKTGTIIGTANYFSPEQAQGLSVDRRSDVYSAGVVLYEMLTREVPFKGDTAIAIAYKHVKEDPEPPSRLNPEVSPELDAVVMKALAKNPHNRYETAKEMEADLRRLLRGESVMATPLLPPDQTVVMRAEQTAVMPRPVAVSKRRRAVAYTLIFALFLSLLALAVVLLLSLFGGEGATEEVPNVIGKDQVEAERILDGDGLEAKIGRTVFSETYPEGTVAAQDPEDGRKVPRGSSVILTISKGPERVDVPELRGKTREEALRLLEEAGLELGADQKRTDNEVEAGVVLDQDPRPGSKVDRGSPVDIVVSGGKATTTVPNVEGVDEEVARERLLEAGLDPVVKKACRTAERHNKVLDQNPPARTEVPEGSTVTITVNKAPPVPQVIGDTRKEATDKLQAAGFKVEVVEVDSPGNRDEVLAQDKAPGDQECEGTTVTITVET